MEEIKVGEYVRTRGIIGKLVRIEYDKIDTSLKWYVLDKGNHEITYVNKPYIEKHSLNIIDLIEVGDYVNGELVTGFGYEDVNGAKEKSILVEGKYTKVSFALLQWDIKSIVTKEQFSNIEYRLGD